MIVDSSALVAILRNEDDAARFANALANAGTAAMSAVNWVEAAVVVDSARDPVASRRFDELINASEIEVVPVTAAQAALA